MIVKNIIMEWKKYQRTKECIAKIVRAMMKKKKG
jgi:hypothetical protein